MTLTGATEPGDGRWNKADVRGALLAMHGFGCAYCLGEFREEFMGDVDHFRPRALYPWLKYQFDNFYLACLTCNIGWKRAEFPLKPANVRTTYATRDNLASEARLLLKPCSDDVEEVFCVDPTDPLARLLIRPMSDAVLAERAETALRLFGLNVFPHDRARRTAVNTALRRLAAISGGNDSETHRLRLSASHYQPHGLAVREVLKTLRPAFVPTPAEEVSWFVADLLTLVHDLISGLLDVRPDQEAWLTRRLEIICHALAVLWKYPPVQDAPDTGRTIEANGLAHIVEPFLERV